MNKFNIVVYAICKNEEKFVNRWMDSMSEADLVVVTDTGSTDKTVEKLRNRKAEVHIEAVSPWRFDVARNKSLAHVPMDADICICTDLDEVFNPGWRQKLEAAWDDEPESKIGYYRFNHVVKDDGTPSVWFINSKIHTRENFSWRHPIHEWVYYTGQGSPKGIHIDGLILNHYPDHSKSRKPYLDLLKLALEEDPDSPRMLYCLGSELIRFEMFEQAISALKRYLDLPDVTSPEEKGTVMRQIAKAYEHLNKVEAAKEWYSRAIVTASHLREGYIEYALLLKRFEEWSLICDLIEQALKLDESTSGYVNLGIAWDHTIYELGATAYYHMGDYKRALEFSETGLKRKPNDPDLLKINHAIEKMLKK